MTLALRLTKGTDLTYAEVDGNFIDLDGRIASAATSLTTLTTAVGEVTADVADLATDIATLPRVQPVASAPTLQAFDLVPRPIEILDVYAVPSSCISTVVDEVLASFLIPGGAIGPNSILQIEPVWSYTNSANNKTLKVKIGSTLVYASTRTTSVREAPLLVIANRNSLTSQIKPYDNNYVTPSATGPVAYAINFALPQTVEILGQRANGADTLTLEYYRILHFGGH